MTTASIEKAVAVVLRSSAVGHDALVFRHPLAGVQFPKGTIEPGETVEAATMRELHEESGLNLMAQLEIIGTWTRPILHQDGRPPEIHLWHIGLLRSNTPLPNQWSHVATGSAEEEGLLFAFHWLPVDEHLPDALEPVFQPVARMILDHLS